jgi:hypothetical protein
MLVHGSHRLIFVGARGNAFPIGKHEPMMKIDFPDDVLGHLRASRQ